MPLVIAPLLAAVTFAVNAAILLEAGLSFLGVGVPLPTPSWGNMLETARSLDVLQDGPWMWVPPAHHDSDHGVEHQLHRRRAARRRRPQTHPVMDTRIRG